ncbi:MAG: serine--tRNA ligase [Legionellales bacterium]|nr:serine--tRNA ligase [Legionellales bacterium]
MLDINMIRKDIDAVSKALLKKGYILDCKKFIALEDERKSLQVKTQALQQDRNAISKAVGQAKAKGENADELLSQVADIRTALEASEKALSSLLEQINEFMMDIPNIPHESVPEGNSELDNVLIREWKEKTHHDFDVLDHVSLCEPSGQMDFSAAAKLSGARFVVLRKEIAKLQRALAQMMLDTHVEEHFYVEHYVPYLVLPECLEGTGQLPKFKDDQYITNDERGAFIIPTAEVPLTNLVREQILNEEDLPLKMVAHTPCFRKEAGSYGKDTRGMFRQHQFEKVELVQVVQPEHSYDALEQMTAQAEAILQKLELPYRVMALCGKDLGFAAAKTYDIEVWLPSQQTYREISSCSNTENFQARRMQARFKSKETGAKPVLAHTLNGSGVAVGRCLIALLENHQSKDGSITIPKALRPYMNNKDKIYL